VHGNARGLAHRHQPGHNAVGIVARLGEHFAVIIGGDAAHVVMHGWQYWDRLAGDIDASENLGALGNAGQTLMQDFRIEMIEVQEDVVFVGADAAAFANF
jgi:hypothetical protein